MLANVPRPGKSFAGLRRYLLATKGVAKYRVAWLATRNLIGDDPHLATKIMDATAALSVWVQRPVYHLIVSWHPDDQPDRASMADVAATTLADIGLAGHQAFGCGPRRHPQSASAHDRQPCASRDRRGMVHSHDYRRIEKSMRRQLEAHGFQFVKGRHPAPQNRSPRRSKQTDIEKTARKRELRQAEGRRRCKLSVKCEWH